MSEKENLLSIREAADNLGRSTKSIRNYIKAGRINAKKIPGPKGPQYVFEPSEISRFAAEQDLEVSAVPANNNPSQKANLPAIPTDLPASLEGLVEAFVNAENERTQLIKELAESKAETQHTIGTLEERVSQLQLRLKREERVSSRAKAAERNLKRWKEKGEALSAEVKELRQLQDEISRRRWWQLWS